MRYIYIIVEEVLDLHIILRKFSTNFMALPEISTDIFDILYILYFIDFKS